MSRQERMQQQLIQEYAPVYLNVEDESYQHHVPDDAQTHYKITMVSAVFSSLSRINRHRLINSLLKEEFNQGLHALSMHLYTPEEWEQKGESVPQSPACVDGYKK